MQLEQGDVVVERLAVVVVVNVGGGDAEGLGAWRTELLGEIVVADANIDGVTGADNVCDTMSCCKDPLGADEGAAAEILIERVDEGNLPAPLSGNRVLSTHNPAGPVRALHAAHELVGDGVLVGRSLAVLCGGEGVAVNFVVRSEHTVVTTDVVVGDLRNIESGSICSETAWRFAVFLWRGRRLGLDLLLFLHGGSGGTADGFLLGAFEEFGCLGVTEAGEGEVRSYAGAGALGAWVGFLCRRSPRGCRCGGWGGSRGGGRCSALVLWLVVIVRWTGRGAGGLFGSAEVVAEHRGYERKQVADGVGWAATVGRAQKERSKRKEFGVVWALGSRRLRLPLRRLRSWWRSGWCWLSVDFVAGRSLSSFFVAALSSFLAVDGVVNHAGRGGAEADHHVWDAHAGALGLGWGWGRKGAWPGGSRRSRTGAVVGSFWWTASDAAAAVSGADCAAVDLVAEEGEETGDAGAMASLLGRDGGGVLGGRGFFRVGFFLGFFSFDHFGGVTFGGLHVLFIIIITLAPGIILGYDQLFGRIIVAEYFNGYTTSEVSFAEFIYVVDGFAKTGNSIRNANARASSGI